MGDVSATMDLKGIKFNFANFQNQIYTIGDNKHSGNADYFTFQNLQQ